MMKQTKWNLWKWARERESSQRCGVSGAGRQQLAASSSKQGGWRVALVCERPMNYSHAHLPTSQTHHTRASFSELCALLLRLGFI